MNLVIVRHAIAEDHQPGQDDPSRELTAAGERKFRRCVQGIRELGWHFDRVLTSPWLRAARTAELLAPISSGEPIATELLTTSPSNELLAMIAASTGPVKKRHATAVVGHQPWLGELIGLLASGDPHPGEAFELKKGGVVWLEGSAVPAGMKIMAMIPPAVLRALR